METSDRRIKHKRAERELDALEAGDGDETLADVELSQLPASHWDNAYPPQRRFYNHAGGLAGEDAAARRPVGSRDHASHAFDPTYVQKSKPNPPQQKAKASLGEPRASGLHPLEQIERSPPHKLMLQLWREEERLLRMQIQAHESNSTQIEQEIYQIFGFDLLFQAILVAGAARASVLDCTTSWVPLVLSLAASLASFLALFRSLDARQRLQSQLESEQSDSRSLFDYVERLKTQGDQFDLSDLPHASSAQGRRKMLPSAAEKAIHFIRSYKFLVLLVFFVCSVLAVVSFRKILCSP